MHRALVPSDSWVSVLDLFLSWMRAAGKPDTTIYLYGYRLRRFALDTGLEPFAATVDDLVAYLGHHDWSANTRKSARTVLRSFYSWAHLTGRMAHSPAALLPVVSVSIGLPRPAPEHSVKVGMHAVDERVRLMVQLGAFAGLRCIEIARVHTDDVVPDLVGYSLRAHGKGDKTRIVPLNQSLAVALRNRERGFVFPGQIDGHLSAAHVSKLISRALPPGVTAHQLRHRFATKFYAAERDLLALQQLLGHAYVATTQIYTLADDAVKRRGVEAIAV